MNAEFNKLLKQMAVRLEGAGMQRGKMMGKCEGCGAEMPMEAKKAGNGEMLCEMCQKKAESVETPEAIEVEEAKKPKLGSGKRFKNLVKALDQRDDVDDPEALAAWIGRMKYGQSKFQKLAQKGRKG